MASANTLFDKAAANLRSAQILYEHLEGDEEQLNMIGYHLQQAMEMVLKHWCQKAHT